MRDITLYGYLLYWIQKIDKILRGLERILYNEGMKQKNKMSADRPIVQLRGERNVHEIKMSAEINQ